MDELKWAKLTEVYGRMDADLIESYLEAEGIDVEMFQEAVGHQIYPTTLDGLAKVQIFVAKENIMALPKFAGKSLNTKAHKEKKEP
jgi:hypothetical protein